MSGPEGREWVMEQLDRFIDMTQSHNLSRTGGGVAVFASQEGSKAPRTQVLEELDTIEAILDRYYPEWRERQDEWASKNYEFEAVRQAVIRCRSRLQRQEELERHLHADAPSIRFDDLHPWVWDAARPQWETGHSAEAVAAAARSLNSRLQQKVGRRDIADKKLVQEAFSLNPPKDGSARLRVPPDDGSETATSMQQGVLAFGVGCMQAIRNPLAHLDGAERELPEHEALERLAALSLFARWIDGSRLLTFDKPTKVSETARPIRADPEEDSPNST